MRRVRLKLGYYLSGLSPLEFRPEVGSSMRFTMVYWDFLSIMVALV